MQMKPEMIELITAKNAIPVPMKARFLHVQIDRALINPRISVLAANPRKGINANGTARIAPAAAMVARIVE